MKLWLISIGIVVFHTALLFGVAVGFIKFLEAFGLGGILIAGALIGFCFFVCMVHAILSIFNSGGSE